MRYVLILLTHALLAVSGQAQVCRNGTCPATAGFVNPVVWVEVPKVAPRPMPLASPVTATAPRSDWRPFARLNRSWHGWRPFHRFFWAYMP